MPFVKTLTIRVHSFWPFGTVGRVVTQPDVGAVVTDAEDTTYDTSIRLMPTPSSPGEPSGPLMFPTLSHSVPAHTYRSPCTRYASPLLPVGGSSLGESKDPMIVTPVPAGPCGPTGPCGPGLLSICVLSCLGVMYDTSSVPAATSASVAGTFFVAPASIPVSLVRSDAVITSAAFALLDSALSRPSTLDIG